VLAGRSADRGQALADELTAAYSISKGALSIMTKNLAFGLMKNNIRVNQVNPGWTIRFKAPTTHRSRPPRTPSILSDRLSVGDTNDAKSFDRRSPERR
jgi:NAD(P)-dependent dehydrogenase (short-subunit alcohol dehydrogenase family)